MLADFKICSINNTDDGGQVITFRFYEGAITTEDEVDHDGDTQSVTCYRRSAVLSELSVNRPRIVFGHLSEADIDALGRVELAKIADHDPIEGQRNA
jgi:hypothetical protein